MTISDKTRKLLWGKSGNQCAFCQIALIMETKDSYGISIVGDECHIVARSKDGPRGDPNITQEQIDSYSNLILLCKVHHKLVDDQAEIYTVNVIKKIKTHHEGRVQSILRKDVHGKEPPEFAFRITAGKELFSIVAGAPMYDFDHDEPQSRAEVEDLASFLQLLQEYVDIGEEIESGGRVEIGFELSEEIRTIENSGFMIFGTREKRRMKFGKVVSDWDVAVIRILRSTNPQIIKIDLQNQMADR